MHYLMKETKYLIYYLEENKMREFKIIRMDKKGELITDYEMFNDMEAAEAWAEKENAEHPGSVVDIEFQDNNMEFKYEW